jgi:hypothetical protein
MMGTKKKKDFKCEVRLSSTLLTLIDSELKRTPGRSPDGRAKLIQEIVRKHFRTQLKTQASMNKAHRELCKESRLLKNKAVSLISEQRMQEASRALLHAASKEIEALSIADLNEESTIISCLVEVIQLIKEATGYKHLPDIPSKRMAAEVAN